MARGARRSLSVCGAVGLWGCGVRGLASLTFDKSGFRMVYWGGPRLLFVFPGSHIPFLGPGLTPPQPSPPEPTPTLDELGE